MCRREMMPLLSLIFSALFILFGTVVIQAFRLVTQPYTRFYSTTKTFIFREKKKTSPLLLRLVCDTVQRKLEGPARVNKQCCWFNSFTSVHPLRREKKLLCFFSDSSEDKQTKPKAKDGTKTENGSPGTGGTSRQEICQELFHFIERKKKYCHVILSAFDF